MTTARSDSVARKHPSDCEALPSGVSRTRFKVRDEKNPAQWRGSYTMTDVQLIQLLLPLLRRLLLPLPPLQLLCPLLWLQ